MSSQPQVVASGLADCALTALEHPHTLSQAAVQDCLQLLASPGISDESLRPVLSTLASVAYARPDLLGAEVADALSVLLAGPPCANESLAALADLGDLLNCLLATPAAPRVVTVFVRLLSDPALSRRVQEQLLRSLAYVGFWAVKRLDLDVLLTVAKHDHLAPHRDRLLHDVIERVLFTDLSTLTPASFERLERVYAGHPSWRYLLAYLAGRSELPPAARRLITDAVALQAPPRVPVTGRLGVGASRVLMVQNIKDGQGDEIIRTVPLLEALLTLNPRLRVVLVTARPYLYAHPRIELVPIAEHSRVRAALAGRFDAVVDFFEPEVLQVNHDLEVEEQVQAHIQACKPWLVLAANKGWGHFVYQQLDVNGESYAASLLLDRQRVANNYETTLRLLVEFGLPVRTGEDPPHGGPVLAGLPSPSADAAWADLVAGNAAQRPVALFWPFGGKPLKGYVERKLDDLSDRLRALIAEGYYVIVQPNGTPWGGPDLTRRAISRLSTHEQAQVVVGLDPAARDGSVTYQSGGQCSDQLTVPYASSVMHLVTYGVRAADLIVTVEGWMLHAAACLGKPYRVLMLPHSPPEWFPYGRTRNQDVWPSGAGAASRPPTDDGAPPLPEQPRKHALQLALRTLGWTGEAGLPYLLHALRSEDHHLRLAAATALSALTSPPVTTELQALLNDPSGAVRATAARALLERADAAALHLPQGQRVLLLAHQLIGQPARDWGTVVRLGEPGRAAIRFAVQDVDPVIRREAEEILGILNSTPRPRSHVAAGWARLGRQALGRWLPGRRGRTGG